MCLKLFDDKRVITLVITLWTFVSSVTFLVIMINDGSAFLSFGPNTRTKLMGVTLDTWDKWWCVAIYTFASTGIAAFSSDAVVPWITNTIQDHKTKYIPYSKFTCLCIIQAFTVYAVIMSVIGMFVALTQVDFMLIRIAADLSVNQYTTYWFLRGKITDPVRYELWLKSQGTDGGNPQKLEPQEETVEDAVEDAGHRAKRECMQLLVASPPQSDEFFDVQGPAPENAQSAPPPEGKRRWKDIKAKRAEKNASSQETEKNASMETGANSV